MLRQINAESEVRRSEDGKLQNRMNELERRHATKDDIEHLNRSIDRMHKSIENLTALLKNENGGR